MTLRSAARLLLVLALGLPIVQSVLFWVAGLLASMGDNAGAGVLRNIGTGCLVAWLVALVALVIVAATLILSERPPNEDQT
jgi:hypothetical protein